MYFLSIFIVYFHFLANNAADWMVKQQLYILGAAITSGQHEYGKTYFWSSLLFLQITIRVACSRFFLFRVFKAAKINACDPT